jgi:hypothetical protein
MTYLLSGFVLSGGFLLALSEEFFWASIFFLISIWIFNWQNRKWGNTTSADPEDYSDASE